jgi:hypothetical protein
LTSSLVVPTAGDYLEFSGDTIIDGGGHEVSFEEGAYLWVDSGISVTLRNMMLRLPATDTLYCENATSRLTLQNVTVCLDDDCAFTSGRLYIDNDVIMSGNHEFGFQSDKPMTILQNSMLSFDTGMSFTYAPTAANRDLVRMTDDTSKLYLNGCTLSSTTTGLRLTKGTLILDNKNDIYADGSTLSSAVAFGNRSAAGDPTIYVMPGASIDVKTGCLDYALSSAS